MYPAAISALRLLTQRMQHVLHTSYCFCSNYGPFSSGSCCCAPKTCRKAEAMHFPTSNNGQCVFSISISTDSAAKASSTCRYMTQDVVESAAQQDESINDHISEQLLMRENRLNAEETHRCIVGIAICTIQIPTPLDTIMSLSRSRAPSTGEL